MPRLFIHRSFEVLLTTSLLVASAAASSPTSSGNAPTPGKDGLPAFTELSWSDRSANPLIQVRPLLPEGLFEDSVATEALNFACSTEVVQLRSFFEKHDLPFQPDLLRKTEGQDCHVFYQPTIKGFRADPDDFPVEQLLFEYASVRFVTHQPFQVGDTLDIIRSIFDQLEQPPTIQVGLQHFSSDDLYEKAKELYFGQKADRVELRNRRTDAYMTWVQDYIKSGRVGTERKILVPHRLYEGKAENAATYRGLLTTLVEDDNDFYGSKLSWEGGDLQFALHPRDPRKLVLFHGDVAKGYWGNRLTPGEYAYVLKQEFGADIAIDLSNMAPHVDYFISFLPADKIALVSEPLHSEFQVTRDALKSLLRKFESSGAVPAELLELSALLLPRGRVRQEQVSKLLERIWEVQDEWSFGVDTVVMERVSSYVERSCPSDRSRCLSPEGQLKMAREELPLLKDWVRVALDTQSERQFIVSHLAIIESQFAKLDQKRRRRLEDKVAALEELGFHVVRVPRITGTSTLGAAWPGISYVNGLLVDKTFFVPSFGLGESEDLILKRLASQLPDSYVIVPVYSQHSLLHNGGIHCISGILRGFPRSQGTTPETVETTLDD